jgi:hypothetical protein
MATMDEQQLWWSIVCIFLRLLISNPEGVTEDKI